MKSNMQMMLPRNYNSASTKDLRRLSRKVLALLDEATDLTQQIELILEILGKIAPVGPDDHDEFDTDPVAYIMDLHLHPNGSIDVRIDNGEKLLKLGRRLAGFFLYIASGEIDCSAGDDLVGWRSRQESLDFLEASAGRKFRLSYVNNLLNILRSKLIDAKYSSKLVQTNSSLGIRMAIKQGSHDMLKASFDKWLQSNQSSKKKTLTMV
jgi:hypothetical protein